MPPGGRNRGGTGQGHCTAHDEGGLAGDGGTLGSSSTHRFLGLAEPGTPLDKLGPGGWLEWGGLRLEVMTARPIWVGGQVTHLWLALRPCPEDGA